MDLDKDVLQAALAKALSDSITPDVQKEVFRKAIETYLFRVDERGNGVLKSSFERALADATMKIASDIVNEEGTAARVKNEMRAALEKAFENNAFREGVRSKIERAFRGY